MKIAVIANDRFKEELLSQGLKDSVEIIWLKEPAAAPGSGYCIDLLFKNDDERIKNLKSFFSELIIINYVPGTLETMPDNFVRINGWPGFLNRTLAEVSCRKEAVKPNAENIFTALGKKAEWVPDIPGFVSARVVSMIINEAYFALEEKVSSKQDIDTAMKLGTNYPYGPFEWSEKIGLKNVYELLQVLTKENPRYTPNALLKSEAIT
ncbi:MAG: 3-hydroxyacyl-CoA dehydrogenase [Sphingobacteriales bacterium]|nr:3-hydroxyacyl-CoA dehydrogenase [Sphingobacteriales bacterium]